MKAISMYSVAAITQMRLHACLDAPRVGRPGIVQLYGNHYHHHLYTSSSGRPVGCMSTFLKQHLNTHKQQLRTLGLQIIIHHTHAPVHNQSHRLTAMQQ
jgi:hypothetical protein